jgi:membrane-bound metal-dependent hydrolase YbcI (DUF457 family)
MPSPVGHILGGAAVYLIGRSPKKRSHIVLSATLLGSMVPDFDFLPGILIGNPPAFHHGISHSLGFALLFGTVVFLILRYFRHSDITTRAALMATFAYGFHAVLDAASVGEGAKAVPLLWPFSPHEFGINLDLFGHFHHDGLEDGIWSVVRRENLPALMREVTVLGSLVLLVQFWRTKGKTAVSGKR